MYVCMCVCVCVRVRVCVRARDGRREKVHSARKQVFEKNAFKVSQHITTMRIAYTFAGIPGQKYYTEHMEVYQIIRPY